MGAQLKVASKTIKLVSNFEKSCFHLLNICYMLSRAFSSLSVKKKFKPHHKFTIEDVFKLRLEINLFLQTMPVSGH